MPDRDSITTIVECVSCRALRRQIKDVKTEVLSQVNKMPQITDQARLLKDFDMEFVSKGSLDGMWRCHYLKCPKCDYFVLKGAGYDECLCGNISIDSDMLRVTVSITPESEVETYKAIKK